jgi:hypothetical protein
MKGIIFNLLEEVTTTAMGEAAWDGILEQAGADGAYTSLGNYADREFASLLQATAGRAGKDEKETLRWFGRQSMPILAQRYPEFFVKHDSLRSFLLSLNDVIHAEVRKLYPGADVPVFQFEMPAGEAAHDTLIIHYRSKRRLCMLAEGFIEGAADHYEERVTIRQSACMLESAPACAIGCTFHGRA